MKPEQIIRGASVTPAELSNAEAAGKQRITALQNQAPSGSLIRFSLNIAGPVKLFPMAVSAFEEGLGEIRKNLPKGALLFFEQSRNVTGPEAFFLLSCPAPDIKKKMAAIEEGHSLGRLFNIDVIGKDGISVSRSVLGLPPRSCLICGEDARICAKNHAHSMELILWRTCRILNDHFRGRAADKAASCAVRALLYEVSATPKPGLVDRNNSGSHKDMDFFTFLDSSAALTPWFRDFFCIGWDYGSETMPALFSRLRFAGQKAEASMFSATGDVNTHKGLIFSFAILCGALGKVYADRETASPNLPDSVSGAAPDSAAQTIPQISQVISVCRALGQCSLDDFKDSSARTAGEVCHSSYGLTGARGEAAAGFPSAFQFGLPALKRFLADGHSLNNASALTLLSLLSQVDDTNMIHRGGIQLASQSKKEAEAVLLQITPASFEDRLKELDQLFIQNNLSPGGCADLLAVSLMFYFLEDSHMIRLLP